MNTFQLTITKIDEALFDRDAISVTVPGIEGDMTILPHHEAFISPLKAGTITARSIKEEGGEATQEQFSIEKGLLEVSNNQVTILI